MNFSQGVQFCVNQRGRKEALRLYLSGLFLWRGVLWEDMENSDIKYLDLISTIITVTNYSLFIKNFYIDQIKYEGDIKIKINLHNNKGRKICMNGMFPLLGNFISNESSIVDEWIVSEVQLRSSWKEQASKYCLHLFRVFNWNDINPNTIEQHQAKYLNGQL